MDVLAYTASYETYEAHQGIEYEFSELNLFAIAPPKNLAQTLLLGTLSAGLILTVLITADPAFAQRNLRQGMQGNDVAQVQTLLRNQGHRIPYGADGSGRGYFGATTTKAVMSFQAKKSLSVDGEVGPRTRSALGMSTSSSGNSSRGSSGGSGYLGLGSKGPRVAELQSLLRNRGYSISYGADASSRSVFNSQTLAAVRSFQGSNGLAVDGVAGPRTMAALRGQKITSAPSRSSNVRRSGGSGGYRVATNSQAGLNIRSGPGSQYGVVGSLPNGARVNVSSISNGWAKVPGGYMSAQFLRK